MLKMKSMSLYYGGIKALNNVSLNVAESEFIALIGANGAGKTSFLNGIMNLGGRKEGKVTFDSTDITNMKTSRIVGRGLTLVPEGRRVFKEMTVLENIEIGRYPIRRRRNADAQTKKIFDYFPQLYDLKSRQAGLLSGGEQQLLAIGRALMSEPKLLLMDEPSMGLSPVNIQKVYDCLKLLGDEGLTILLVEQNAVNALKYADRGYVLEHGSVILQGDKKYLEKDNEIMRAYLGNEYSEKWER